jgi:hypothetical protein
MAERFRGMGNALIRSFGKGTFHKPPLSGSDVGTKRLYRIEPGDLLFSNVFAWEGAIAIAQPRMRADWGPTASSLARSILTRRLQSFCGISS